MSSGMLQKFEIQKDGQPLAYVGRHWATHDVSEYKINYYFAKMEKPFPAEEGDAREWRVERVKRTKAIEAQGFDWGAVKVFSIKDGGRDPVELEAQQIQRLRRILEAPKTKCQDAEMRAFWVMTRSAVPSAA